MTRQIALTVTESEDGMRVDAYLAARDCYASRSQAAKRIEEGKVYLNGTVPQKRALVAEGDTIVFEEDESVAHMPLQGEDIPLDVRFEDEWMAVISKQAGLCVHPAHNHESGTLVNALIARYGRDNLAHVQGDDRPGVVHRLDMDTSGLMMCAFDDACGFALQDLIREHAVDRRYITLVHGNVAYDTGMIDEPIARAENERLRMRIDYSMRARNALTTFTVLERFEAAGRDNGFTLLECKLYTGRTHQIRVHMEHIGHCCVGDPLYRWGDDAQNLQLRRQFLHSYKISVDHPMTGATLELVDGFPPDLATLLEGLAPRSMGRTAEGKRILAEVAAAPSQTKDINQL